MTKAKFLTMTVLMSAVIFVACSQDNVSKEKIEAKSTLRESFLKDKDFETAKSDFNALKEKEKIDLWNEKLDQLLTQNLPAEHKKLIKELKTELKKSSINVETISNISVRLTDITPENDFYKMFTSLENYKFEEHFVGTVKVNDDLKKSLKSLRFNYTKNVISNSAKSNGKPCNCNWTCSLYAGGSTRNCSVTTSGCGFLWAFECENRVGPVEILQPLPTDSDHPRP